MDGPILIIPDIHQDARFLDRVLERGMSGGGVSGIVLLGDLLDARSARTERADQVEAVVRTVASLLERQDPPTKLLWGNHDWKYWEAKDEIAKAVRSGEGEDQQFLEAHDYSLHASRLLFGKNPEGDFLQVWNRHAALVVFLRGHLLSHAGVHSSFWSCPEDVESSVDHLNRCMRELMEKPDPFDSLLGAGPVRGGFDPVGGPLWLDFDHEFVDDPSLPPQIVGHTSGSRVRRKGRSWCLDTAQGSFGLLHADGSLEVVLVDRA